MVYLPWSRRRLEIELVIFLVELNTLFAFGIDSQKIFPNTEAQALMKAL
jgi:hypothetical protein